MPSILRKESVVVRESPRATPMLFPQWAGTRPYVCAAGGGYCHRDLCSLVPDSNRANIDCWSAKGKLFACLLLLQLSAQIPVLAE